MVKYRGCDLEPCDAGVFDPAGKCGFVVDGFRYFLPTAADVTVFSIEAGGDAAVEGEASFSAVAALDSAFPPGAWQDVFLNVVTLDTVEGVGLVGFVEDTDWHQEHTNVSAELFGPIHADEGLLQFDFAVLILASDAVFELELRIECDPVVELVVEKEHETVKVDFVVGAVIEVGMQFTVTTNRGVGIPRWQVEGTVAEFFDGD